MKKIIIIGSCGIIIVLSALILILNMTTNNEQNNIEINDVSNIELLTYEEYKELDDKIIFLDEEVKLMKVNNVELPIYYVVLPKYFEEKDMVFFGNEEKMEGIIYNVDEAKQKESLNPKLRSLGYYPYGEIYYTVYPKTPPIILIIEFDLTPNQMGGGRLYVEFTDGSCYFPGDFDEENNPEVCDTYLQKTLDYLGYENVDDMLFSVFGELVKYGEAVESK